MYTRSLTEARRQIHHVKSVGMPIRIVKNLIMTAINPFNGHKQKDWLPKELLEHPVHIDKLNNASHK